MGEGADLCVRPGGGMGGILDFGIPSWEGQGWVSSILNFGFFPLLRTGYALRSSLCCARATSYVR